MSQAEWWGLRVPELDGHTQSRTGHFHRELPGPGSQPRACGSERQNQPPWSGVGMTAKGGGLHLGTLAPNSRAQ